MGHGKNVCAPMSFDARIVERGVTPAGNKLHLDTNMAEINPAHPP